MIDLDSKHSAIIAMILKSRLPQASVYVFGSRVTGKAKRFSDLDLAIDTGHKIDFKILEDLREAFSASDLPIRVDVVDYQGVSQAFRDIIDGQKKPLN